MSYKTAEPGPPAATYLGELEKGTEAVWKEVASDHEQGQKEPHGQRG